MRGLSLIGVLLAFVIVLRLAGTWSDLPPGYGTKQYEPASDLVRRSGEWSALRRGAGRDVSIYIPSYLVAGLVIAGMVGLMRPVDEGSDGRWWARLAKSPLTLGGGVVGPRRGRRGRNRLLLYVAQRLIDGAGPVGSLVRVTQVFTVLKFGAGAIALGLLV